MSIRPTQPQSIGGVLDTTFQLYRASVLKVLPLSLLMAIASSPPTIYVFARGGGDPNDPFAIFRLMGSPGYLLWTFVSWIATVFVVSAISLKTAAIAGDGDLAAGTALQKALLRLPSQMLSLVLYLLVVGIALVMAGIPVGSMGLSVTSVLLGAALMAPAVLFSVSLLLFVGTSLFDGKGPIAALLASHRLVWGNWWRMAAILAVGFVILLVIYTVAVLIAGVMTPLMVLSGGTENFALIGLIGGLVVGVLLNLLLTPFYVAMFLAIYWDLKLRKEGGDLAARIGSLNPA